MATYDINYLIDKLYVELDQQRQKNQKNQKSQRLIIEKPIVSSANKKTYITNFKNICDILKRDENGIIKFFENELRTNISVDINGCLVINGAGVGFKQQGIENILNSYITQYVMCKECKSCDTGLNKENRILFITCKKCLSKKAIT